MLQFNRQLGCNHVKPLKQQPRRADNMATTTTNPIFAQTVRDLKVRDIVPLTDFIADRKRYGKEIEDLPIDQPMQGSSPFKDGVLLRFIWGDPKRDVIAVSVPDATGKDADWTPRLSYAYIVDIVDGEGNVVKANQLLFMGVAHAPESRREDVDGKLHEYSRDSINGRLPNNSSPLKAKDELAAEFEGDGMIVEVKRGERFKCENSYTGRKESRSLVNLIYKSKVDLPKDEQPATGDNKPVGNGLTDTEQ